MSHWIHQDKQQLSALASLVAASLSEDLTVEEIELMRSFLLSIVALLGTIAFQQRVLEKEEEERKKKEDEDKKKWEKEIEKRRKKERGQKDTDELIEFEEIDEIDDEINRNSKQKNSPNNKHIPNNKDGHNNEENKMKRD